MIDFLAPFRFCFPAAIKAVEVRNMDKKELAGQQVSPAVAAAMKRFWEKVREIEAARAEACVPRGILEGGLPGD